VVFDHPQRMLGPQRIVRFRQIREHQTCLAF
jgi:hypothetical protein